MWMQLKSDGRVVSCTRVPCEGSQEEDDHGSASFLVQKIVGDARG